MSMFSAAISLPVGCNKSETASVPRVTSHGLGTGYEGFCLLCHGPGTGKDEYPSDHPGRTNDMCLTCHHT